MPTQDDHAEMLRAALPEGPPFEGEDLQALIRGLSGAAARFDTAIEDHVTDFIPTSLETHGTYIDDWADLLALPDAFESDAWDGYTDAQKASVIRAKLRGGKDPNLPNLLAGLQELFNDPAVTLSHREHPAFLASLAGAGSTVGDYWTGVWVCRYMDSITGVDPDDFGSWTTGSVSANTHYGPISEALTADTVTGYFSAPSNRTFALTLTGTADGDSVRLSMWLQAATAAHDVYFVLRQRDGSSLVISDAFRVKPGLWQKFEANLDIGSGGSDPVWYVTWANADGTDIIASHAQAGVRQESLELRAQTLDQVHTVGVFRVKGEDE